MGRDIGRNIELITAALPFLSVSAPPSPWVKRSTRAVGGLTDVGFGRGSDLLLIISSQGRGVLDGLTGEMVARDRDDSLSWFDAFERLAAGIGPLMGQQIHTGGQAGGGLTSGTRDGWSVEIETFEWPLRRVILKSRGWYESTFAEAGCTVLVDDSTLRAAGFSPTGRSLILATSSDVTVYSRI